MGLSGFSKKGSLKKTYTDTHELGRDGLVVEPFAA